MLTLFKLSSIWLKLETEASKVSSATNN